MCGNRAPATINSWICHKLGEQPSSVTCEYVYRVNKANNNKNNKICACVREQV